MQSIREGISDAIRHDATNRVLFNSIFGSIEPESVADLIRNSCSLAGLAPPSGLFWFELSVGAAIGLRLEDDKRVFLKVLRGVDLAHLTAIHGFVSELYADGFPCPAPLGRVVTVGDLAIVPWEFVDDGEFRDASSPQVRSEMASVLARLHQHSRAYWSTRDFTVVNTNDDVRDGLWPEPHNVLFDFSVNVGESEWVDHIATKTRARILDAIDRDETIVSHLDWSAKHFRFGDSLTTRVVYDWDSVFRAGELRSVGLAAATHQYNWYVESESMMPSTEQMRAFVDEYEQAARVEFDLADRSYIADQALFTVCYIAKCKYSADPAKADRSDEAEFLRNHGTGIKL